MHTSRSIARFLAGAAAAAVAVGGAVASGTVHAEPQGFIPAESDVGYLYQTFGGSPIYMLLVGGTAEEFCLDSPEDTFNTAEPGSAPSQTFLRADGSVDVRINDQEQPIYLYEAEQDAPVWIADVCADMFDGNPDTMPPAPIASGTAGLKVRVSVLSADVIEVFNSVNGELVAPDGAEYRVRASADLVVENGVPVGNPADFVSLEITEIGR